VFNSSHTPTAQHVTSTLFKGHYSPIHFFNFSFFLSVLHQGHIKPSNRLQHSFTCSKYRNSVFWHIVYVCFPGNSLNIDSIPKHHISLFSMNETRWIVCKLRTEVYLQHTVKVSSKHTFKAQKESRGRAQINLKLSARQQWVETATPWSPYLQKKLKYYGITCTGAGKSTKST